ncbi:MAG: hypothetical protein ACXW3E_01720 [Thermoanaerobaculia bacterium]
MTRTVIASLAFLIAASIFAAEDKPPQTTTTPDSPLVAAAKKSNRSTKKKRVVITNDTLKNSTGHISTANSPAPNLNLPVPAKPAEQVAAEEKKARETEQAAAKTKTDNAAADDRQKQTANAARVEDEGPYNEGRPPDTPKKTEEKKP